MNVRRGFFRLWIVASIGFFALVAVIFYQPVASEFKKASDIERLKKDSTLLVPVKRGSQNHNLRGDAEKDYECDFQKTVNDNPFNQFDVCWYELPKFRVLFPEHHDISDTELSDQLYQKADIPLTPAKPWSMLAKILAWTIGISLLVLLVGKSLFWAFSGFSAQKPT